MPQEWKLHPEVSRKHDNLYAGAWKCEYRRPIFDAQNDNATPPKLPEIAVQSGLQNEETCETPGTARERSLKIFPQIEELCDITDTYR